MFLYVICTIKGFKILYVFYVNLYVKIEKFKIWAYFEGKMHFRPKFEVQNEKFQLNFEILYVNLYETPKFLLLYVNYMYI